MMTQVSTGPPTITTHPTSQLTTISMRVTLNCEGTGRGSITYQWQARNINGGQWSVISNSNNRRLSNNSRRLVVRNLQESQQYRCVVFNEAGGTRSYVATVTVLSKYQVRIIKVCIFLPKLLIIKTAFTSTITWMLHNRAYSVTEILLTSFY